MSILQDGEALALEPLASRRNPYIGNRAHGPDPGVGEKVLLLFFSTYMYEDSQEDSSTLCVSQNGRFHRRPRQYPHQRGSQPRHHAWGTLTGWPQRPPA